MKCTLMNKNTEVILAEYDSATGVFTKVYDVYNIDYAPYILKSFYTSKDINDTPFRTNLSEWFKGKGIPSGRDKLDLLLHRLNISAQCELLNKAFDYAEFMEASLSKNSKMIQNISSLKTPNNTTDGMLKKAWIIEDGTRYLLKSGYKNKTLQPFNEVLASEICKRLGFNHVEYTLDTYKDTVVSKCPCFITKDTELITCHQIRNDMKRHDSIEDYEEYIKKLESEGIKDVRTKIENMYILDFLIMNEDRHLNNFGIIRDVNTLRWLDVAPIFDNGQSLNIEYYDEEEMHITGEGKLFYEVKSFDELIKIVKDIKRIDVNKLENLPEWFDDLLHEYQSLTGYSDTRINRLCILLNRQINKLKKLIENS